MATVLRTRTEPLHIDLARLEQDADAIAVYHQEINRRIAYLLPRLTETLRLTEPGDLHADLSERASALGIATLRTDSLLRLAQLFHEEGWDMAQHLFGPHPATLRAREKQAFLPVGVHVQKTALPARVGGRLILVTRIGDRPLERAERFAQGSAPGHAQPAGLYRRARVWPAARVRWLADQVRSCGGDATYVALDSPHGHDAFLKEWEQMTSALDFIKKQGTSRAFQGVYP